MCLSTVFWKRVNMHIYSFVFTGQQRVVERSHVSRCPFHLSTESREVSEDWVRVGGRQRCSRRGARRERSGSRRLDSTSCAPPLLSLLRYRRRPPAPTRIASLGRRSAARAGRRLRRSHMCSEAARESAREPLGLGLRGAERWKVGSRYTCDETRATGAIASRSTSSIAIRWSRKIGATGARSRYCWRFWTPETALTTRFGRVQWLRRRLRPPTFQGLLCCHP